MYVSSKDAIVQTNSSDRTDVQPNINAENVFNTKTMTLGKNVQTLVILIPNEGPHTAAGEDNEARFLDPHFVPENAVFNGGTCKNE